MRRLLTSAAAAAALALAIVGPAAAHEPTCVDFGALGIGWPIAGGAGQYVAGDGAAVPGGPGPGFHFPNGFAPGASFCNEQSRSPGAHF